MLALALYPIAPRYMETPVHAQFVQGGSIGSGFVLNADDLRFIYRQILVAQEHVLTRNTTGAPCPLIGPGPNQISDPQMPKGLRTVDGTCNNVVPTPAQPNPRNEPNQYLFGSADRTFPRLTTPVYRDAETNPATGLGTSYKQKINTPAQPNVVYDSQPRVASNLIVDQTASNPAAVAAALHPCGSGGFVCSDPPDLASVTDPDSGALFIPNITPDFGLSAPFNLMFAFFGQFFDHGLDLVTKGGGMVIMPLKADDPLIAGPDHILGNADDLPPDLRFMAMTRGQNQPGPDGILGTADDIQEGINETTPWVDQNQTYTSHPSHQVFLREYAMNGGKPVQTGLVLDGGFCTPRPTGIPGDQICDIGNWLEVKTQAAQKLGIHLVDQDVFNVPLILTDPYGHFKPGPNGFPQLVLPGNNVLEGNPAANGGAGVDIPANALRTGHAFLNDIAHNAAPGPDLTPDLDNTICDFRTVPSCQPAGTYDDELLNRHFITGDGRGNENIGLTMVHNIFHAEHNRLRYYIDQRINSLLTTDEIAAWHAVDSGPGHSGWNYEERLFQAARLVTEMEYQHLVFEEFARTIQPLINPFLGGLTSIDAAISAEFAHTVYRLGHSMLPERLDRINDDGTHNEIRLFDAFLNPLAYNSGGPGVTLNAAQAAGSLIRGLSRQIGNELDEFITESVRNQLVGLPLDLAAINMARGRSEGIPSLNKARAQFFALTQDAAVQPYANWSEFRFGLKHDESFANFLAAYATDPRITSQTTLAGKRTAAILMAQNPVDDFFFQPAATSGLDDVDFWVGGLAEKQAVFGGLLGSTFNYVFELQLEHLQDGDRFYYLQRLDGTNLVQQLEGNSFAELARRNTTIEATMDVIFNTADFTLTAADFTETTAPVDMGGGISVFTQPDGTKVFFDPLHAGKNIVINGTAGDDRWKADVGDDTMLGNDGNDRLDGYEGNDTLIGGNGDDVLLGGNGDDVLKGGPGNDALNSGPGFGGDLEIGGDGNDFMVGGNDGVEYFGGPGDDVIVDGSMRAELIQAGDGDDWIDDGEGHDGGMFGDEANNFDLLAGLNVTGGDDVEGGGPGQDNHFGFGGDDIYLMSEGSNKFFGDFGFDWITLRGWNAPEFIELDLLPNPNVAVNFNDTRNFYRFVDGASGWTFNDHIAGSNSVLCDPPGEVAECLNIGMELVAGTAPVNEPIAGIPGAFNIRGGSGAAKIAGLTGLMAAFGAAGDLNAPAIPDVKGVGFMGGDILLGGPGSDTLEGKKGDDLIDGDAWLNVQLRAVYNDGHVRLVDSPRDLVADIFASPNPLLNPGNISIVRNIVDATAAGATTQTVPAPDCGAPTPLNCDTAVFAFPRAEYVITRNANNTITVQHVPPAGGGALTLSTGTDTLRNVERVLFSDGVSVDLAAPLNNVATGTVTISSTTPTEGALLTVSASITDADGFNPAAIVFDWQAETAPGVFSVVSTGPTFTPGNPQVGQALRVTARFIDNAGFSEAVRSDPTAPVTNVNNPPVGAATLSQTLPQEGEAILASPAGITDADGLVGVAFNFQWQQAATAAGPFTNIAGATSVSFTPAQAQVNQFLRVNVTFTDNHGTAEAVASDATGVVGDLFVGTGINDAFAGTAGRDNASGNGGNDTLDGNGGDDVLNGNAGNDTLLGGGGNDTLTGGNADDTINGGPGDDLIRVGVNDGVDDVNGGGGVDTIQVITGANNTVIGLSGLVNVEFISGNGAANVSIAMTGGGGDDTFDLSAVTLTGITAISMDGGDGSDTLVGSAQVDTINGGAGADNISGGGGADIINGGGGADTINGGGGADDITGGGGNDTLTGGAGANIFRLTANFGNDTITDFNPNGAGQDFVNVSALGITTAAQFNARSTMVQVGADTVVTIFTDATRTTAIGSIRFVNVANAQLNATDFGF